MWIEKNYTICSASPGSVKQGAEQWRSGFDQFWQPVLKLKPECLLFLPPEVWGLDYMTNCISLLLYLGKASQTLHVQNGFLIPLSMPMRHRHFAMSMSAYTVAIMMDKSIEVLFEILWIVLHQSDPSLLLSFNYITCIYQG